MTMGNKNTNLGTIIATNVDIGDKYNITNVIEGLSYLLSEYKVQLKKIEEQINLFKPKTALDFLIDLELRVNDVEIQDKNKILSKISFLKALCKYELNGFTKEDTAKDFINAYKLNPAEASFKERASVEYLNLSDSNKALKLANEILEVDDYNKSAWFVKSVTSKSLKPFIKEIPKYVLEDYNFKISIVYHIVLNYNLNFVEDLEEYGLKLDIEFEKYKTITFNNLEAWRIGIDLSINKILNDYPLKYISGDYFNMRDIPLLNDVFKLIGQYIEKLDDSELKDITNHQKFFYNYFGYLITNEDSYYLNLKNEYDLTPKPHWHYTFTFCQILNHRKEYLSSLACVIEYENLKGNLNSDFYLLKSALFHFNNKSEEIENVFDDFIKSIDIIDERNGFNILTAILKILYRKVDEEILKRQLTKILLKEFKSFEIKELLEIAIRVRYLDEFDQNEMYSRLCILTNYDKYDVNWKNLLAESLKTVGRRNEAIEYLDSYVDKKNISESLRLFICLIHDQLYDKKHTGQGRYDELIELLKFWRLNNNYIDEQLIGFEHNLFTEINDLHNLEEIDKFLYDKFPEDEQYLLFYLVTLERKKDYEKIKQVSVKIPIIFNDETTGVNIAGILLRNKSDSKKGFEILYNLASDVNNIKARKNYLACSILAPEFFVNYKNVELGHWVVYKVNSKIERKQVLKLEGIQKEFFEKKVGDKFYLKSALMSSKNEIEIIEIYNDALKLFRDISEEANNPVNELGFQSFQVPSDIKDFEKFLIEQFGAEGSQEKMRTENLLNDYYNYKIGFTEVTSGVFKQNYIDSYIHLTNVIGNKFTTLPNGITKQLNIEDTSQKFILDFSVLLLFYFLEKELNFEFKHKFIVSFYAKSKIENELMEVINSPESPLSINVSLEGVRKYFSPENYKTQRIEFLQSIINWIDERCEIDLVKEKLNVTLKLPKKDRKFQDDFMKLMIDSMHFSLRQNHRLISSDSSIFLFNNKSNLNNNIINPEKYLLTYYSEKCNPDFYRFLLKSNYLGININYETLKNEFFDFVSGRENYYLLALENLQYSVNNNPNILFSCIQFFKYLYLSNSISITDKNRFASEIFRNTFYGMPIDLLNKFQFLLMSEFKLLGNYYDHILKEFSSVRDLYFRNK